ncbi:MAG: methyltransferase domain-containing protein [Bacteroidetes bacterium]|jgi:SAM-dependent methyltransferase|nr:methyltransferase domain-containing protein [Bacteroidota bacterium]
MVENTRAVLDPAYWDAQYAKQKTGWDIGTISPPLKAYIDQLTRNDIRVLVPGAGKGWEVNYLFGQGFKQTFLLDFSATAIEQFKRHNPTFPESQIIQHNFFDHQASYDLIIEQTFFSSLPPEKRQDYVQQMHKILAPGGKLCGLLFNHKFDSTAPPYGDTEATYRELFAPYFHFLVFETAYNSIKPRAGRELFFLLKKI